MLDLCHPHILSNLPGLTQDKTSVPQKFDSPPDVNSDDSSGTNAGKPQLSVTLLAKELPKENIFEINTSQSNATAINTIVENTNAANNTVAANTTAENLEEEKRKARTRNNLIARFFEWITRFGSPVGSASECANRNEPMNVDSEEGTVIGGAVGLFIASVGAFIYKLRGKFPDKQALDPFYRRAKTFFDLGTNIGPAFAGLIPIPEGSLQKPVQDVIGAFSGVVIAILALPLSILGFDAKCIQKYCKTGTEGFSKYLKTAIIFGVNSGGTIAAAMDFAKHNLQNLSRDILRDGAISAGLSFAACAILVPVINKLTGNALMSDDSAKFRNNYIRAGITSGSSFGAVLGFVLGTFVCPGLGSALGMSIGGVIGGVIGGATIGAAGHKITQAVGEKNNQENSWDYGSRTFSYVGAYIGAIIGFFTPIPGGALIGATVLGYVGAAAFSVAGAGVNYVARKIQPQEQRASFLPWTQRVATGGSIGSIVGGVIGFVAGLIVGGPLGGLAGAVLGGAIGGVVGSAIAWLSDPVARNITKEGIKKLVRRPQPPREVKGPLQSQLSNGPTPSATPPPPSTPNSLKSITSQLSLRPESPKPEQEEKSLSAMPPTPEQNSEKITLADTNQEKEITSKISTNQNQFFYHPALQNRRIAQPVCSSEFLPSCMM